LPIKSNAAKVRKLPRGQYDDFNAKAQALLDGRMITTTEFNEYYAFMKSMHFDPDALLVVIKKCVELKGFTIGYHYILTIAKNLAYMGLTTGKSVAEKFNSANELDVVIKELRTKRKDFIKRSYDPKTIKEIGKNEPEF
jgi:hypothetical protein